MDDELLFRIVFVSIYIVFTGVRVYYRSQELGRESEKEYNQKNKAIIFLIFSIIGYFLTLGLWIIFPQVTDAFQTSLPALIRWFGVGAALVAIVLTIWIHHTLGRQYSAKWAIQKNHELIMVGPYRRVRHPMYVTLNLFSLSVSLITANMLIILFAICVAIPFFWIAKAEEEILIEQFGEEYVAYMKITGRFFPRFVEFKFNRGKN